RGQDHRASGLPDGLDHPSQVAEASRDEREDGVEEGEGRVRAPIGDPVEDDVRLLVEEVAPGALMGPRQLEDLSTGGPHAPAEDVVDLERVRQDGLQLEDTA